MPRMTKAEREAREATAKAEAARIIAHEARVQNALRWTEPAPAKDVPPPKDSGLTTGYLFNDHSQSVAVACSSAVHHAFGRTDRTTTQQPAYLYSTRLLALKALRATLEREFAVALANIDEQIEQELLAQEEAQG